MQQGKILKSIYSICLLAMSINFVFASNIDTRDFNLIDKISYHVYCFTESILMNNECDDSELISQTNDKDYDADIESLKSRVFNLEQSSSSKSIIVATGSATTTIIKERVINKYISVPGPRGPAGETKIVYTNSNSNENNTISGVYSSALGFFNKISSDFVTGVGYNNTITATGSSVFGNDIVNTIPNTVMIGPSDMGKLTIYYNGAVEIKGPLVFNNTTGAPGSLLMSTGSSTAPMWVPTSTLMVATDSLRVGGKVFAQSFNTLSGSDMAEMFPTKDLNILPGSIVMLNSDSHEWTDKDTNTKYLMSGVEIATDTDKVIGVIATNPGVILGSDTLNGVPVAYQGRVPVLVNNEGGIINKGDAISLSSVSGIGKKATSTDRILGIALTDMSSSSDKVLMLISSNYNNREVDNYIKKGNINLGKELNVNNVKANSGNFSINENGQLYAKELCLEDKCLNRGMIEKILNFFTN